MRTNNGSLVAEKPMVAFRRLCIELRRRCEAILEGVVEGSGGDKLCS